METMVSKTFKEKFTILALVFCCAIGCDQTSKRIAEQTMPESLIYSFFYDTIRLQYVKNTGAFLGFGADFSFELKSFLFLFIPIFLLVGASLLLVYSPKLSLCQRILVTLMISGGVGNLIDRIFLDGGVTDFVNLGIGSLRTGIFNFADVILMVSAFLLMISEFLKSPKRFA